MTEVPWYVAPTEEERAIEKKRAMTHFDRNCLLNFKVRPVQFGALPAAAKQLFTKPRSRPKIEPNFEALSWCSFYKEKPENFVNEPGALVNSLVSGTPRI